MFASAFGIDEMKIALARNGKIENIIVADQGYQAPDGYTICDNADAAIGDTWDGSVLTKFVHPTNVDGYWNSLRVERDRRLAETDWWSSGDLTMTDEQKAYRQALRDLPATAGEPPIGDEDALAAWPVWPTKP